MEKNNEVQRDSLIHYRTINVTLTLAIKKVQDTNYVGIAVKSPTDKFNKTTGKKIAERRLLQLINSSLSDPEKWEFKPLEQGLNLVVGFPPQQYLSTKIIKRITRNIQLW